MKTLIRVFAFLLLALPGPLLAGAADVEGTWLTGDGDGLIEIRIDGTAISATVLGSPNKDPNRPRTDVNNPDPSLRGRPLIGLDLFAGFRYEGDDEWSGGSIYDPNSGKTYSCRLKLIAPDKLKVRGFIGIALIGRTEIWKRQPD